MFSQSPISCTVPLNAEGRHIGSLDLMISDNEHYCSVIPIPIVVLKNGEGPTVLVSAGNHGNEEQGQVVVRRLIAELDLENIQGTLFLLPSLNLPAARADTRTSPLDGQNLNRSFPGEPRSGPTSAIAHFLTTVLLPMCDAGIDLHSAGKLAIMPTLTYLGISPDKDITRRSYELLEAFGFSHAMICDDGGDGMDDSAHANKVPFIGAEFEGGCSADPAPLQEGMEATLRFLVHTGVLKDPGNLPPPKATVLLDHRKLSHVRIPFNGFFWPACEMLDEVQAGDVAGTLYSFDEVGRPPEVLTFPEAGVVTMRRIHARCATGDFVISTAPIITPDEIL